MTLAIETSCDDTAVAILEKTNLSSGRPQARLLFNKRITTKNSGKGGIVPIEALASHEANLATLVSKAIKFLPNHQTTTSVPIITLQHGQRKVLPDFISVTRGPGMRSNLTCGLNTAKGLASAYQIPLVGVHHMQAHALTPRLEFAMSSGVDSSADVPPEFPLLTLLISGGHSMLLHSRSLVEHQIIANTRDIAIGDALDKCGRVILPDETQRQAVDTAFARDLSDFAFPTLDSYSTWPIPMTRQQEIEKEDNEFGWKMKNALSDTKDLSFSFTSISSTIERLFPRRMNDCAGNMSAKERLTFARTALGTAFEHLISRTVIALQELEQKKQNVTTLVVSGGVAANSFLRHYMRRFLDNRGYEHVQLLFPRAEFCTDNAAMIAWAGMEMFEAGYSSDLDIGAVRKWSMDSRSEDGGVLGVQGWKRLTE